MPYAERRLDRPNANGVSLESDHGQRISNWRSCDGGIGLRHVRPARQEGQHAVARSLQELAGLVGQLEKRTDLRGLLFRSGKPGQFIAGADLNELAALATPRTSRSAGRSRSATSSSAGSAGCRFPTVALIDGNCMGGGTELVLSMDERIVSTAPHTKIGLPEGQDRPLPRLGRHPAAAATDRPEPGDRDDLLGRAGLGRRRPSRSGFAFDAVPAERLVEEGRRLIEYLQQSGEWKERASSCEQPLGLNPRRDARSPSPSPRGPSRARPRASIPRRWPPSRRSARAATCRSKRA